MEVSYCVVWQIKEFFSILTKYVEYIKWYYGKRATVVLYGYPEEASSRCINATEPLRNNKNSTPAVQFSVQRVCFLSNEQNRCCIISFLIEKLQAGQICVKQVVEDADTLIVNSTLEKVQNCGYVVIVGEDTNLLVLLTALIPASCNSSSLYILKSGKGKLHNILYTPKQLKYTQAVE